MKFGNFQVINRGFLELGFHSIVVNIPGDDFPRLSLMDWRQCLLNWIIRVSLLHLVCTGKWFFLVDR